MHHRPFAGSLETLIDMCSRSHVHVDVDLFVHENGGLVLLPPSMPTAERRGGGGEGGGGAVNEGRRGARDFTTTTTATAPPSRSESSAAAPSSAQREAIDARVVHDGAVSAPPECARVLEEWVIV